MTVIQNFPWLEVLLFISGLGNVLAVVHHIAHDMKYHEMNAVCTDFRWYMKALVPRKYHVQGHKPAEPDSAPAEYMNDQQTWIP